MHPGGLHETDSARHVRARGRGAAARVERIGAGGPRHAQRRREGFRWGSAARRHGDGHEHRDQRHAGTADVCDRVISDRQPDSRTVPAGHQPHRVQEVQPGDDARNRPAEDGRRDARGRFGVGDHHRRRHVSGAELERQHARYGDSAIAGREPAAGDPQLGRPARARAGRAGRPLYRAGRRHVVRPHRRRQRARHARAAEQLPARRRRQQQHLRERAGADVAGVAAVGGRDSGVQGRDEPLRGRVRPVARRGGQRLDQIGDEQHPRYGVRVFPQREDGHPRLLLEARQRGEAGQRPEPVRRQSRRARRQKPGVFLRRLRAHTDYARCHSDHTRADGGRAQRPLHDGHPRSADRPAVREQSDSCVAHRSFRGRDHGARAGAESAWREQLLPQRGSHRQLRPRAGAHRLSSECARQHLRALHLLEPRAGHPRRIRRRRRRDGHVGIRQPDDQDARVGRRLDARDRSGHRQRVPGLVVTGRSRMG